MEGDLAGIFERAVAEAARVAVAERMAEVQQEHERAIGKLRADIIGFQSDVEGLRRAFAGLARRMNELERAGVTGRSVVVKGPKRAGDD